MANMALFEAKTTSPSFDTSVFGGGSFPIKTIIVDKSSSSSAGSRIISPPPKPLLIVTPTTVGNYPVVLFFNGFLLHNHFYTQLLQHISSHGFIIVAPQLYEINIVHLPSALEEIESAASVTDWLEKGLEPNLPQNVSPNLNKLALAGHSRGGKAAFALALGHAKTSLEFSVLLGIDPVAGPAKFTESPPKILSNVPRSFTMSIPVAVIGTGLGSKNCFPLGPPCAPEGVNHENFYYDSKPPRAHFVAEEYGHLDMLDDNLPWIIDLFKHVCVKGDGSKDDIRRSMGGIVVAFLRAYLESHDEDLKIIVANPSLAPAKLAKPEFDPA